MRVTSVTTLEIVACFAVAAAGLVPIVQENRPFWGLSCISFDGGPPRIHHVESDSPAEAAGLRVDDVIVTANESPVDNSGLIAVLDGLIPGAVARLRVKRAETELDVSATALEPPIAMIYYPTFWHPIAGGFGLAFGLLVLATQPLRPAPRWRALLVALAGIALGGAFFIALAYENPFAYWQLRRYHNVNWGTKWHFEQSWVGLVASLGLANLGAWELRALLRRTVATERGSPSDSLPPIEPA